MQKLIWENSKGERLDLTSAPYGITEWEGFSGIDLNVQTQKVPFQDGSVFIDALYEDRTIAVTLAIYDGNNLETRYRLRRALISALNPKAGEGYLIYKNDYIEKRIKAIANNPIFETHNSDMVGTPKASLSWTCCDPYWEDVEETTVYMKSGSRTFIENNGDVPCGVKISLLSSNVTNPEVKSFTQNKKIKLNGTFTNNVEIDTNIGSKKVYGTDVSFNINNMASDLYSIAYSDKLGLYVAGGDSYTNGANLLLSKDGVTWEPRNYHWSSTIRKIIYVDSLEKFIFVMLNGTLGISEDGETWTVSSIASGLSNIIYAEEKNLFVACSQAGKILTSSDLENWTTIDTGLASNFFGVVYSATQDLFVVVGANGVVRISSDGVTWTSASSGTSSRLWSVCYSETLNLFVVVGENGVVKTSADGSTWNNVNLGRNDNLYSVCYSEELGLFVIGGEILLVSENGTNWQVIDTTSIRYIIYFRSVGLFYSVGQGNISYSFNGYEWTKIIDCLNGNAFTSILYCEEKNLFLTTVGAGYIAYSNDGKKFNFKTVGLGQQNAVCYSKKLDMFIACGEDSNNRVFLSSDGINWTGKTTDGTHWYYGITYSEELELFVLVGTGGTIQTSVDGITWTEQISGVSTVLYDVIYKNNMFIVVGASGVILTSNDGITWTSKTSGTVENLNAICYSDSLKLYVIVGENETILTSADCNLWTLQRTGVNVLSGVAYSDKLGMFVVCGGGAGGYILVSSDGENWASKNIGLEMLLTDCIFVDNQEAFFISGINAYVLQSQFEQTENLISNLSADSDMTLGLELGKNQILLNNASGELSGKLIYRQKYIGV